MKKDKMSLDLAKWLIRQRSSGDLRDSEVYGLRRVMQKLGTLINDVSKSEKKKKVEIRLYFFHITDPFMSGYK